MKSLFGIAMMNEIVDLSAHVPTFYAPIRASDDSESDTLIGLVLPVVAILCTA